MTIREWRWLFPALPYIVQRLTMFSNRLASHLERGVVGFPTTLASSVGLIMASPVILTVTSGFGMGGDTFALAVLLAFIMMQAQVTTFAEAATLIPTTGSVYDYISCGMGRFFAITGALCAYLIVHIFAGTAETILAGIMALVNFESVNAQMAAHQNTWMVGVGMVVIFGLLNAIGVEIFGKVEVVLTFGMWTTLTIFGLCGIFMAPVTHLSGWFGTPLNVSDISGLFGYIGMAMFMFVGCELVTPMAPEIKKPTAPFRGRWRWVYWASPAACLSTARRLTARWKTWWSMRRITSICWTRRWRSRPSPSG